jgi:hypothetical protein
MFAPIGRRTPRRYETAPALPAHLGLDRHAEGLLGHEIFESIINPGKLLLLVDWKDENAARAWQPASFAGIDSLRHRQVRMIRVYGMHDRAEAPQFYPSTASARQDQQAEVDVR